MQIMKICVLAILCLYVKDTNAQDTFLNNLQGRIMAAGEKGIEGAVYSNRVAITPGQNQQVTRVNSNTLKYCNAGSYIDIKDSKLISNANSFFDQLPTTARHFIFLL